MASLPLWVCAAAHAETGLSLAAVSDYRYRGVSLSDGKPAVTATVTYDHPSGAYLGVTGVGALTPHDGAKVLGYQAYVGYAHRFGSGDSWDVGVASTDITEYYMPRYTVRYAEVYAGVAGRNLSAHIYYSPNYLGEQVDTVYAAVDGSLSPGEAWRVFAHAGLLTPVSHRNTSELSSPQYDFRAGVARRIGVVDLQVSAVAVGPDADYPANHPQKKKALLVGAAWAF